MIKVLGLDVSSSCIGYGLIAVEHKQLILLEHGHIKPPTKDKCSIVERLNITSHDIEHLCSRLNPDYVVIEDIVQFMAHRSSAGTIIMLAIFNRLVALQIYRSTNKIPLFLLPISIRSRIRKYLNMDKLIQKEDIPFILQNVFGTEKFVIKYIGKKNKIAKYIYDEADGCAAAFAGIIELGLLNE